MVDSCCTVSCRVHHFQCLFLHRSFHASLQGCWRLPKGDGPRLEEPLHWLHVDECWLLPFTLHLHHPFGMLRNRWIGWRPHTCCQTEPGGFGWQWAAGQNRYHVPVCTILPDFVIPTSLQVPPETAWRKPPRSTWVYLRWAMWSLHWLMGNLNTSLIVTPNWLDFCRIP